MTGRKKELHLLVGTSALAIVIAMSASANAETGRAMGSGVLNAEVEASANHTDNLFATDNNEEEDTFYRVTPRMSWTSNWASGNELELSAEAVYSRFDDFDEDDADEYSVGASGLINLDSQTAVRYSGEYKDAVEDRGNASENRGRGNGRGSLEPVEYQTLSGGLTVFRTGGVIEAELGVDVIDRDYEDGRRINPTAGALPAILVVNNDDRDSFATNVHARVERAIDGASSIYVEGNYNWTDYDNLEDNTGLNRDSEGYTVGAGLTVQLSEVSLLSIGGSYHDQNFDDAALQDVDGFGATMSYVWLASELTTVTASATHTYEDTPLQGVSGSLTQAGALEINHQLLPNLSVTLDGSVSQAKYEGVAPGVKNAGLEREDDVYTTGISFNYDVNERISLGANADYTDRDSNIAEEDYNRTRYGATAKLRL